jgi:hypothetical protein
MPKYAQHTTHSARTCSAFTSPLSPLTSCSANGTRRSPAQLHSPSDASTSSAPSCIRPSHVLLHLLPNIQQHCCPMGTKPPQPP